MSVPDERPTVALDPKAIVAAIASDPDKTWPLVMAVLERAAPWATYAFRLGVLSLLSHEVNEMSRQAAPATRIASTKAFLKVLSYMPWEGKETGEQQNKPATIPRKEDGNGPKVRK